MEKASLVEELKYTETHRPAIKVLLNTESIKEIRLVFKKDQFMKRHQAAFPIVVEVFEGQIEFGVNDEKHTLSRGDLITLKGNTPHDLLAREDSIVRLSLSKSDNTQRVQEAAKS